MSLVRWWLAWNAQPYNLYAPPTARPLTVTLSSASASAKTVATVAMGTTVVTVTDTITAIPITTPTRAPPTPQDPVKPAGWMVILHPGTLSPSRGTRNLAGYRGEGHLPKHTFTHLAWKV